MGLTLVFVVHWQWFTGTTVTKLTPKENDVEFDVHESDCGEWQLRHHLYCRPDTDVHLPRY